MGEYPYVQVYFSEALLPEGKRKSKKVWSGGRRPDKDRGGRYWWYVEKGHGGPHPAPPHPYFDAIVDDCRDEALEAVEQKLLEGLK